MAFHAIRAGKGKVCVSAGVQTVSRYSNGTTDHPGTAVRQLVDEGQDVSWVACEAGPLNSHLSRIGTCLIRELALWNVRTSAVEGGDPTRGAEGLPTLELCQAEEGARILNAMVCDVTTCSGGGAVSGPPRRRRRDARLQNCLD